MVMYVLARWSALCGRRRRFGGFCTSKEKPSSSPGCKKDSLSLFLVSSGDVCGKKTNPCGEDAVCNQTNVHGMCQCKAGFQRSQESGQCEGDASTAVLATLPFPPVAHVSLSVVSAGFKARRHFVATKLAQVDRMFSCVNSR